MRILQTELPSEEASQCVVALARVCQFVSGVEFDSIAGGQHEALFESRQRIDLRSGGIGVVFGKGEALPHLHRCGAMIQAQTDEVATRRDDGSGSIHE